MCLLMNFSLKFLRELFVQFIWMIPVHTILGKVELLDNLFIWIGEHIINDNVTYFVFAMPISTTGPNRKKHVKGFDL